MGPRLIDIDILFFNNEVLSSKSLTIPHPEIANRRFALLPLNEIAPDVEHPVLRKTVTAMLRDCPDNLRVEIFSC
jgi:2-amino-4-hydroxy-6-hydroxymethyldihydropteridine diphosphokinase